MGSPTIFKSPLSSQGTDISGTQSSEFNPFINLFNKEEHVSHDLDFITSLKGLNTSFKVLDAGRPSLAPIDINFSDMSARESLGILPNTALSRDSLISGFLNTSIREMLEKSQSPRESLGVLNLSAMDLGRESIGIFNIQNSFLRKKSIENELKDNLSFNLDDFNFDNIENGLKTIKKSPLQSDNPIPELILSTSTTQEKLNSLSLSALNNAFILTHSRMSSVGSSYHPYFNSRSLEEPSKISPGSQKESEVSQSALARTDPFNEAFQISTRDNSRHTISQILTSTNAKSPSDAENMRNRIQSLPIALGGNNILADIDIDGKALNDSFQGAVVCRGSEEEKEFNDSVFLEARKVASIIADSSFNEKSFDEQKHNILDATPQPEWPTELDSSHSNIEDKVKSPKSNKDAILKQMDKMLGMQPVNLEEKLKLKNGSKSDSSSLDNISQNLSKISKTSPGNNGNAHSCTSNNFSQNISKISRTSHEGSVVNQSCASNNFSQNLSKITQTSEENVSRLIQNLSDILNENDNLSHKQKEEGRHMLNRLANMLRDSKVWENLTKPNDHGAENYMCNEPNSETNRIMSSTSCSAEDSGHSSVDGQHLEENKSTKNDGREAKTDEKGAGSNSEEFCQALDLSCKGKSCSKGGKRLPTSTSPALVESPAYPAKKPNDKEITNTSIASIASNASDTNKNASKVNYSNASNCSTASAQQSGNLSTASRHSNISQNRVTSGAGKLRKSKVGVVAGKKGPLRAVLPVENMAKGVKNVSKVAEGPVTPERKNDGPKFGLVSKKTSTPIQEPKLKPMAASTPANRQSKDSKEQGVSPLARPKYNRSFSYQPRTSTTLERSENARTRDSTSSTIKSAVNKSRAKIDDTKIMRRNSITEGTLSSQKDSEGPMRIKRSFSTGKETKILSALNRVRQNILNSPYYNPKKSGSTGDVLPQNVKKIGTDLRGCGQELKRLSMMSQSKKPGKENLKP